MQPLCRPLAGGFSFPSPFLRLMLDLLAYPLSQCRRRPMSVLNRRSFLQTSVGGLSACAAAGAADGANDKVRLAFIGVRGRGKELMRGFGSFPDVEIAYVCDPDENVVGPALKEAEKRQKHTPKVEKDLRRVLEDKEVTAVVIA